MPPLPLLSGRKLVKVLAKAGYEVVRQRGSHLRLACPGRKSVTVPDYRTIDRHLLLKILRDSELSVEQFTRLL